jgi:hypothetical protein
MQKLQICSWPRSISVEAQENEAAWARQPEILSIIVRKPGEKPARFAEAGHKVRIAGLIGTY